MEPAGLLPDLSVLLALIVGLMSLDGSPADPARAVVGTALCVLVGGALSRMSLARGLRALEERELVAAEVAMRWTVAWAFLAWLGCLFLFDWGSWVNAWVPRTWWLGRYAVLFLPAVAVYAVGWAGKARIEAVLVSLQGGVARPSDFVSAVRRSLRKNGIAFLPLLLVLGIVDGVWVLGELGVEPLRRAALWLEAVPIFEIGFMILVVLVALPFIPSIFVRVLRAAPLEAGRLRTVLEGAARSIGLRYRDIMVWPTGGRVFNAMVVGFTPRSRTIFLTDGLLGALTEEEVVAVFFHEAGHAKRHHLPLFILMFFSLTLLFHAAGDFLTDAGISPFVQILAHLAVFWFVLLGWVSRKFERESDVFGAEHASFMAPEAPALHVPGLPGPLPHGAALMMRALERIRAIVGSGISHRHGSVEDRVSYVAMHATDPDTRREFGRTRRALLAGIAGLAVAAVGASVTRLPVELAQAQANIDANDAAAAYKRAWQAAHADDTRVVEEAGGHWQEAYDRFDAAARRLESRTEERSQRLRVGFRFNAADTALHGLRDVERARRDYERTLQLMDRLELRGVASAALRFQAHVELGRIAAWEVAALPAGDPGRDMAPTERHEEAARVLLLTHLSDGSVYGPTEHDYYAERLRLLEATKEAARGETAIAREILEGLAKHDRGSVAWQDREWVELAEDAQRELERLPRPAKDG